MAGSLRGFTCWTLSSSSHPPRTSRLPRCSHLPPPSTRSPPYLSPAALRVPLIKWLTLEELRGRMRVSTATTGGYTRPLVGLNTFKARRASASQLRHCHQHFLRSPPMPDPLPSPPPSPTHTAITLHYITTSSEDRSDPLIVYRLVLYNQPQPSGFASTVSPTRARLCCRPLHSHSPGHHMRHIGKVLPLPRPGLAVSWAIFARVPPPFCRC